MDLLIDGGRVLDPSRGEFVPAAVAVEGSRIVEVSAQVAPGPDTEVLDARGKYVVPGLINAHTHAHANLVRAIADDWTLEDLLNFSSAVYASRSPEEHYLSAALGALEMVRTGCTSAYDLAMILPTPTPEDLDAVAQAYVDVGMRAVIAPAIADIPFAATVPRLEDLLPEELSFPSNPGKEATAGLISTTRGFLERWQSTEDERVRVALAPSIPGQCTDALLGELGTVAKDYGAGIHVHLAETRTQAAHAYRRWGRTIVAQLQHLGLLGPGFVGAHGIWLTAQDISILADTGATIVHNPASNMRLGSGAAPVRELVDAGVAVGIGTDGSTTSDNQNMFEAMRLAGLSARLRFPRDPDRAFASEETWRLATQGGARALGMQEQLGTIAPGQKADLCLLDAGSAFLTPVHNAYRSLVYSETGGSVDTVLIDGRVVLSGGSFTTVDEGSLIQRAAAAAEQVMSRGAEAWKLSRARRPYLREACIRAEEMVADHEFVAGAL